MKHKLVIKLPNGDLLQVDVPPQVLMGGGKPPTPPTPPNEPPEGDDMFEPMPEPSKADVLDAISLITTKYRYHNKIAEWTPFTHAQIAEIVDSVRHMIYKHEGILPPKQ